jgi:hypothetical protein
MRPILTLENSGAIGKKAFMRSMRSICRRRLTGLAECGSVLSIGRLKLPRNYPVQSLDENPAAPMTSFSARTVLNRLTGAHPFRSHRRMADDLSRERVKLYQQCGAISIEVPDREWPFAQDTGIARSSCTAISSLERRTYS